MLLLEVPKTSEEQILSCGQEELTVEENAEAAASQNIPFVLI